MDPFKDALDGLKAKGHAVGPTVVKYGQDSFSAPQYVTVDGVEMPITWTVDLNDGRVTLAEIAQRLKG